MYRRIEYDGDMIVTEYSFLCEIFNGIHNLVEIIIEYSAFPTTLTTITDRNNAARILQRQEFIRNMKQNLIDLDKKENTYVQVNYPDCFML